MANEIERAAASLERRYVSGALSEESAKTLIPRETVLEIAKGLGKPGAGQEILLVTILLDDSTSVATNINEIYFGYSQMLKALRSESSTADVQVHSRALNRGVLSPYTSLASIGELST